MCTTRVGWPTWFARGSTCQNIGISRSLTSVAVKYRACSRYAIGFMTIATDRSDRSFFRIPLPNHLFIDFRSHLLFAGIAATTRLERKGAQPAVRRIGKYGCMATWRSAWTLARFRLMTPIRASCGDAAVRPLRTLRVARWFDEIIGCPRRFAGGALPLLIPSYSALLLRHDSSRVSASRVTE